MTEFEELCDKIEECAREAQAAAARGDWKLAAIELDAARYLASDAKKISSAKQRYDAVTVSSKEDA